MNWFHPDPVAVCRPALPKDTADVIELTRSIWGGHDYVPEVWADWLSDPQGRLAVLEWGGRVVGLSKLSWLGPGESWMEGLRVHPKMEGRGFASRLFDYTLDAWRQGGEEAVRLTTMSSREAVRHLCERTGFAKIGEFTAYAAPALAEPVQAFQSLRAGEIPEALETACRSPSLALSAGMMDLGWMWGRPTERRLEEARERGQAWWWKRERTLETGAQRGGLVTALEDEHEGQVTLGVQLIACPLEQLSEFLTDFRRLGAGLRFGQVSWTAPIHPAAERSLAAAGFERGWDASVYLYEKWRR